MTRISVEAFEEIEVDLWGTEFVTRPITRSVERKINRLNASAESRGAKLEAEAKAAAEAADPGGNDPSARAEAEALAADAVDDAIAGIYAEVYDFKLKSANGSKVKASTLVLRKWKADEVSLGQITGVLNQIARAENPELSEGDDRPS